MRLKIFFFMLPVCMGHVVAYQLGIEHIPKSLLERLRADRTPVGLVTNHTGRTQRGVRSIDLLRSHGLALKKIFVPEHGLHGAIAAQKAVDDLIDSKTHVPVISLYQAGGPKHIDDTIFAGIDVVLFDMQDIGMRHFTYISTLYTVLEAAARLGKKVIVFDRPNPLGSAMEGPICEQQLCSFVGIAPIPLRHGMTIGELAQLFNKKMLKIPAQLTVVPMALFDASQKMTQLPSALSPNVPTIKAAHGYSFLGLLGEVRPFNVGLGSKKPFQLIALPDALGVKHAAWRQLQQQLLSLNIKTKPYSYIHAQKRKPFSGLALRFDAIDTVPAFKALISVLSWAKEHQIELSFAPLFDKAVGTKAVRQWVAGAISKDELLAHIHTELEQFLQQNRDVLLYGIEPTIVRHLFDGWQFGMMDEKILA